MTNSTCERCRAVTAPHDTVGVASPDGPFRLFCSRCFNSGMAHFVEIRACEHLQLTPMRLAEADGVVHTFHFCSFLLGDRRSLEAFDPGSHDEDGAGFRFQLLGDPESASARKAM